MANYKKHYFQQYGASHTAKRVQEQKFIYEENDLI